MQSAFIRLDYQYTREGMHMNENTIALKTDTLASNITRRFTGHGPLASDIEAVYDELDAADSDVRDAVTSPACSGLKSLFIQAVFFDGRCSLHSLIKDTPDYLLKGYLECVTGIYRDYKEKTPDGERMSNRELAGKVAELLMKGIG